MKWTPDEFWNCLLPDFLLAQKGWQLSNGITEKDKPITKDDMYNLMARFPDEV